MHTHSKFEAACKAYQKNKQLALDFKKYLTSYNPPRLKLPDSFFFFFVSKNKLDLNGLPKRISDQNSFSWFQTLC